MTFSQTPAYNLKVVLMETGIKADVLRAWERRYGLPMPQRSAGRHRLYSQRDVETIRWLLTKQSEGLSISRAVDFWNELQTGGIDPLEQARQMAVIAPLKTIAPVVSQTGIDGIRNEWLAACLAFNESLAEQTLNQAFALYPVETVCVDVLQSGLVEIGERWYKNRVSVQQEHFASALAMRRLDALLAAAAPPTRSQIVLVGCPSGEGHSFTALLLALFLRRRGLHVIYLGANIPEEQLEETVQAVRADLVVLTVQQLATAATLQQAAAALAARGVMVGYGGRILGLIPDLQKRITGHFLGANLMDAIEHINVLLTMLPPAPQVVTPTNEYIETLQAFLASRTAIDAGLEARIKSLDMPMQNSHVANHFMGDNIIAALRLGDMAYIDGEIHWLAPFLARQKTPLSSISIYLKIYLDVLHQQLGEYIGPIAAWLEGQIEETKNF